MFVHEGGCNAGVYEIGSEGLWGYSAEDIEVS